MHSLVDAAWPHRTNGICYQQETLADHGRIKILEIYVTEDNSDPEVDIIEKTFKELSHDSDSSRQCCFRLVIITRSWRPVGTSHEKLTQYNISQEDFTRILDSQGLTSFFCQTRVDVAGLFSFSMSHPHKTDTHDGEYFALIYDAFLGLWARYDRECKQWQGVFTVTEASLDLKAIAEELINFVQTKMFLYLLVAKYTVDFLGLRSGELPMQVAEIERHSGHHDSILRPVPAIYEKLETMSANATATANLVSYYKIVISHLADELLQFLEESCDKDSSRAKDVKQHVAYLRRRVKSLSAYLRYLERRAERQVTATLHLVNQANASTNLAVAHDTKILAMASKRDSSSMKILAAVTTTFLPGAFVATLFSMNMFNWFAGGGTPIVSGRFWIYWSITIPLTLITVGIWLGWEFWTMRKQKKQHQSLNAEDAGVDNNMC